ncbi:MAG: hypothetical protein HY308_08825 [Gammaproteobacteria bacterium]|nr:hypothetical protein [Gammaproteobacteria bacterium]
MRPQLNQPGETWISVVRKIGTPDFQTVFAPDVELNASTLNYSLIGPSEIGFFFSATSKMYESLEFTDEVRSNNKIYLEWQGVFHGQVVKGVTILSRNEIGKINSIKLFHSPRMVLQAFSLELRERLTGILDSKHFD